jgi:hypothetical protein
MRNGENPRSDVLKAAIAVHDQAARDLMRQAGRHLRQATALTRQLGSLDAHGDRSKAQERNR